MFRCIQHLVKIGIFLLITLSFPGRAQTPRAALSDHFPGANIIEFSQFEVNNSLNNYTEQPGEPAHAGLPAVRSGWLRYRATTNGWLYLQRQGAATGSLRVAVYTNDSFSTLVPIAAVSAIPPETPTIGWEVTAGQIYNIAFDSTNRANASFFGQFTQFYVRGVPFGRSLAPGEAVTLEAVDTSGEEVALVQFHHMNTRVGYPRTNVLLATLESPPWIFRYTNTSGGIVDIRASRGFSGTFSLRAMLSMLPPGDLISDPIELPPVFSETRSRIGLALGGLEPGEYMPLTNYWPGKKATAWWRWTPTHGLSAEIYSDPQGFWAVYQGDPRSTLPVASGFNRVKFNAAAGATYYMQMVVFGEPVDQHISEVSFKLEALRILYPEDAVQIGDRSWRLARPTARLIAISANPAEPLTGFMINGEPPSGIDSQGRAYFDISLGDQPLFNFTASATNLAGSRVALLSTQLGYYPNDDPGAAGPAREIRTDQLYSARYLTLSPDEPVIPGNTTNGTIWWEFRAEFDTDAEIEFLANAGSTFAAAAFEKNSSTNPAPLSSVFVEQAPSGWPRAGKLFFPVKRDRVYLIGAASASSFSASPAHLREFRWVNVPERTGINSGIYYSFEQIRPGHDGIRLLRVNLAAPRLQDSREFDVNRPLPWTDSFYWQAPGNYRLWVTYETTNETGTRNWSFSTDVLVAPENDYFEWASYPTFGNERLEMFGTNDGSSVEAGEPAPFGPGLNSVWHRWVAPGSTNVTVTARNGRPAQYAVFRGTSLTNLVLVATNTPANDPVTFATEAGASYYFAVTSLEPWVSFTYSYILEIAGIPTPAPKITGLVRRDSTWRVGYDGFGGVSGYGVQLEGASSIDGPWTFIKGQQTAPPPQNFLEFTSGETNLFLRIVTFGL